jgi:opacity protein-like surface antigen
MDRFKVLSLAGLAALVAVPAAHAADLLPPAPQFAPVYAPVETSGWYLRGDLGVGAASLGSEKSTFAGSTPDGFAVNEKHLDDSAFAGVGAGYQFNNWFRADVTGEYRTSQRYQAIESYTGVICDQSYTGYDTYNGSIQSSVFLANGYVDFGHWGGWTPYVGAGVGVSYNHVASLTDVGAGSTAWNGAGNGGLGWAPDKTTGSFAWAAMAGVSFDITHNLKLDINYRYLDMGDAVSGPIKCTESCAAETQKYHLASNDVRIGLRYMFGQPVPPPPPAPPIVTKY